MDKQSILIIDDDSGLRRTLSDILKAKGYDAFTAGNGMEGLALSKQAVFNVALIDLKLPDMPGMDVLNRIKSESPSTEAIVLTGNASLDTAIEATNKGAFSYMQKPYEIDQLALQIQRAIEKQGAEAKIIKHANELQRINAELKTLYEITLAVSRTIDLRELLTEVLRVTCGMATFGVQRRGAVFLTEEGALSLASSTGLLETELAPCQSVRPGECLCGLAAASGELIVSRDALTDPRHAVKGPRAADSHGHIIVPLKTPNRTVGVLCLYLHPGAEITDGTYRQFASMGNQIGIAIENAQHYERAKYFSYRDPLTGLANRRLLDVELEKGLDRARRYGRPLSVVMIDIDRFKRYNDERGHVEGDRLLATLAGILLKQVRGADNVFRYGGEEFLILLPETGPEAARTVAERVRKAVEAETGVTVSLGVSSYAESSKEGLIARADSAMYRAKQQGRNRVEVSLEEGEPRKWAMNA